MHFTVVAWNWFLFCHSKYCNYEPYGKLNIRTKNGDAYRPWLMASRKCVIIYRNSCFFIFFVRSLNGTVCFNQPHTNTYTCTHTQALFNLIGMTEWPVCSWYTSQFKEKQKWNDCCRSLKANRDLYEKATIKMNVEIESI